MRIGIIGGTGREGRGVALRWARAGHEVVIGSRDAARAVEKAAEFTRELGSGAPGGPAPKAISGGSNEDAARAGEVVLLTVPYAAHDGTLAALKDALAGRVLVDITVPLQPPKVSQVHLPAGSAAALEAQALLGPGVRVVSCLHHVSSAHFADTEHPIDCDVLVCGDDEPARTLVMGLVGDLGVRAIDAGVLRNAIALESLTSVLLYINRKYKTNSGIRITGLG